MGIPVPVEDLPGQYKGQVPDSDLPDNLLGTPTGIKAEPHSVGGFVRNIPGSAYQFASGIGEAAASPIESLKGILRIGAGLAQKITGSAYAPDVPTFDAVMDYYKKKYGSWDNAAYTMYNDPVGFTADLSSVLGIAGSGAKLLGLAKAANVLKTGAGLTDPINVAKNVGLGMGETAARGMSLIPGSNTPVQQAAINFGVEQGVPLTQDIVTGNMAMKGAKGLLKYSPFGSGNLMEQNRQAVISRMSEVGQGLAEEQAPGLAAGRFETGLEGRNQVRNAVEDLRQEQRTQYSNLYNTANAPANERRMVIGQEVLKNSSGQPMLDSLGNPITVSKTEVFKTPVDVRQARDTAQSIIDEINALDPIRAARAKYSPAYGTLQDIAKYRDYESLEKVNVDLGALKGQGRNALPGFVNQSQRIAKQVVQPLHDAVADAATSIGKGAELQAGAAATIDKYGMRKIATAAEKEPVKFANGLLGSKDSNAEQLSQIRSDMPGLADQLGKSMLTGMMARSFTDLGEWRGIGFANAWESVGPKTKEILFSDPALRTKIDKFAELIRTIGPDVNPSQTAKLLALLGVIKNPAQAIPEVVAGRVFANMLLSQNGDRTLSNLLRSVVSRPPSYIKYWRTLTEELPGY